MKILAGNKFRLNVKESRYSEFFKFAFVRNPWARAYSWYANFMRDEIHRKQANITSEIAFPEYLREYAGKGMLRPQTYWIKDFSGGIALDFVGKFESLAEDFQTVRNELGMPHLSLPHLIEGPKTHYREHYDKASISLIESVYREEIELFEYSF